MATVSEPATIQSRDPRTCAIVGEVPVQAADEVAAAVERARHSAQAWSQLSIGQRVDHLLDVRDLILDRADDLVATICAETGKPEAEALSAELLATCEMIEFYKRHARRALKPERVPVGAIMAHKKAWRTYEPMGVVGVISPWNYPFTLAMTPTISALLAGNTVVLKPSEVTPFVGLAIGKVFEDVGGFPDIVQIVTGEGSTGDALVRSGVQKVSFTGSVRTGKA